MRRSVLAVLVALSLLGLARPSRAWVYGGWYGHGGYGHGGHSNVVIGLSAPIGPYYGYPYPYGYGYAYPYAYPYPYPYPAPAPYAYGPPASVQSGPVQMQQQDQSYWYYCQSPQGYYPYIQKCSSGWMQVVPPQGPPS